MGNESQVETTKDIKKNMYYDKPSEVRRRESRKLDKRILQERIEAKAAAVVRRGLQLGHRTVRVEVRSLRRRDPGQVLAAEDPQPEHLFGRQLRLDGPVCQRQRR